MHHHDRNDIDIFISFWWYISSYRPALASSWPNDVYVYNVYSKVWGLKLKHHSSNLIHALSIPFFCSLVCPSFYQPEGAVTLTDGDAAEHSVLVGLFLAQKLTDDVSPQTEAHNNQQRLRKSLFDVAHHCLILPGTTWMKERHFYNCVVLINA